MLDLTLKVKAVIADLSGLEVAEIKDDSELADLGIGSLAVMEMVSEIEATLKVKLPDAEVLMVTDMLGLIRCVAGAMGLDAKSSPNPTREVNGSDNDSSSVSATTSSSSDGAIGTNHESGDTFHFTSAITR